MLAALGCSPLAQSRSLHPNRRQALDPGRPAPGPVQVRTLRRLGHVRTHNTTLQSTTVTINGRRVIALGSRITRLQTFSGSTPRASRCPEIAQEAKGFKTPSKYNCGFSLGTAKPPSQNRTPHTRAINHRTTEASRAAIPNLKSRSALKAAFLRLGDQNRHVLTHSWKLYAKIRQSTVI
jgi:hypothetical protein